MSASHSVLPVNETDCRPGRAHQRASRAFRTNQPLPPGNEAVLGLFELGLRDHGWMIEARPGGYRCLNVTLTRRVTSSVHVAPDPQSANVERLWLFPTTVSTRRRFTVPARGIGMSS